MKKYIILISTTMLAIVTILFLWTFKHRLSLPYNSEGNFFDESTVMVYHEQSVLVYGLISLFFLVLTLIFGIFTVKKFRKI